MDAIRPCREDERGAIFEIINTAAEAYRGAIPADCWHEPYMSADALDQEIAAGVAFYGFVANGALAGVMGVQSVLDVDLIRHAYVRPGFQGRGIGGALLRRLRDASGRPMLVGAWADAAWAIAFYQRYGFRLVAPARKAALLRTYWSVSERQIEASVVLADPPFEPT